MTENAIRLERTFAHSPEAVWAALTTPDLLAKWWAPGDISPVVGHRFTMDMGGWGQQQCEVTAVEPGTSITFVFAEGTLDTTITWARRPPRTARSCTSSTPASTWTPLWVARPSKAWATAGLA